jgi:hypothetical protein
MATVVGTRTLGTVRDIRRSQSIRIDSRVNEPVFVRAIRETIVCDEADAIVGRSDAGIVARTLTEVADESVTLPGGLILTGAQVALAVELFVEKWDAEDIAAAAPPNQ